MSNLVRFLIQYPVSLVLSLYAHTIGVAFKRHRAVYELINGHFGLKLPGMGSDPPQIIPAVPLSAVCPDNGQLTIVAPEFESGGTTSYELICITMIARHYHPSRLFEIGSFKGRTTVNLAANTEEDAKIFTLDLPPGAGSATSLRPHPRDSKYIENREIGRYFRGTAYENKIEILSGDSAAFDYAPYKGTMDMVFVDGSHSRDYVLSDSEKAMGLLKNGKGVVLWHDYGTIWHEVTQALNELYKTDPRLTGLRRVRGTSIVCGIFV